MFGLFLIMLTALLFVGYFFARGRATRAAVTSGVKLHSLPNYHGALVAAWTGIPAFFLVLFWLFLQDTIVQQMVLSSYSADILTGMTANEVSLLVSEIKAVAGGRNFSEPSAEVVRAAAYYNSLNEIASIAMLVVGLGVALVGMAFFAKKITPEFRARQAVEKVMTGSMIACSILAIFTTLGIIVSLTSESWSFFTMVSPLEFFFGLAWEPQIAMRADQALGGGAFGAVPVFAGTLLVAVIAMAVATPIGLFSAIYLAEYATPRFRSIVKPVLEILAGVPTIVYGFFAALVVAPALRDLVMSMGIPMAPNSALVAGAVMGIMIIPFVSSFADDAIKAVPQSMRDGAYGLGATHNETVVQVLLPAALPGIVSGLLLAVSRAIGETMIVVMAAGTIATLTANPLSSVTTVTVQIVSLLIGDTEFDSPKTLAAFALGITLFLVTLALNVIALRIVQKYREEYE